MSNFTTKIILNKWDFVLVNIYKSQTIITHCCDSFRKKYSFFYFFVFVCTAYGSCLGTKLLLSTCGVLKSNKRWIILKQMMSKCYFKLTHNHKIDKKVQRNNYTYAHIQCRFGQNSLNRYFVYFYCFELCEQKWQKIGLLLYCKLQHTQKIHHPFPWIWALSINC